jgi:hypothetical protein
MLALTCIHRVLVQRLLWLRRPAKFSKPILSPLLFLQVRPSYLDVQHASPSHIVEHLICIGDPQQLRPNISTFGESLIPLIALTLTLSKALSMDSTSGRELFKFDRSLMERLSDMRMTMSQINVQRRMRPTISHFVRCAVRSSLQIRPRP